MYKDTFAEVIRDEDGGGGRGRSRVTGDGGTKVFPLCC